ncbi:maltase 1-like [Photinus pyralis]|uniref:maltase 1-like n=1 Tax=Photinus pyralis TaxID=7054 RepID=UPI0012676277|nr:maltase 1-like [Photinus pyralis]
MFLLQSLVVLLALGTVAPAELDWWQNAVFYQIYPRSFKDSDNDGTGDLRGVIQKLDHLVETGVTALWLSPIYPSPQVDFGYDISDFTGVDPLFGDMGDFMELTRKAKAKGLRIILDFVPNHSSDQHEWFKKSENSEPGFEDFYVWKDGEPGTPPNSWTSYFHGPAWTWSTKRNQWYFHQFASAQPDLNYRNPKVVQEMKKVLTYWLDLGVDGFRVDIITALFEDVNYPNGPLDQYAYTSDQPETYDMVYQWRILLDEYQKRNGGDTRVMMTESYADADKLFGYYGNSTHNGAHFSFNFWFITQLNRDSTAKDIKGVIDKWFRNMPEHYTANWVLGNHDQHRVATRYGPGRVDGLNMIAMLLPGVVVTYNGEEIGMENGEVSWEEGWDPQGCNGNKEDWYKNSRDFERTPYQWDGSANAGFNEGHKTWLPVSEQYKTLNLALQRTSTLKSHYRVYQELVKLRQTETLKLGKLRTIVLQNNVLVIIRELENEPAYVAVVNVGGSFASVDLSHIASKFVVQVPSVQSEKIPKSTIDGSAIYLVGFESVVLATVKE